MSDTKIAEHNGLPVLDYVPVGRTIRSVDAGVMTVEAEGEGGEFSTFYYEVVRVWKAGQAFTIRGDGPYVWREVKQETDANGALVGFTGVADLVKP